MTQPPGGVWRSRPIGTGEYLRIVSWMTAFKNGRLARLWCAGVFDPGVTGNCCSSDLSFSCNSECRANSQNKKLKTIDDVSVAAKVKLEISHLIRWSESPSTPVLGLCSSFETMSFRSGVRP